MGPELSTLISAVWATDQVYYLRKDIYAAGYIMQI